MTLAGAFAGGSLVARFGVRRILPAAAAASSVSILLFAWLATRGHDMPMLVGAVTADNFASGVAGTPLLADLCRLARNGLHATPHELPGSRVVPLPKPLAGGPWG